MINWFGKWREPAFSLSVFVATGGMGPRRLASMLAESELQSLLMGSMP